MKNYQVWFIIRCTPKELHRYNTKAYQFLGVDENGKLVFRKMWLMQFPSFEAAMKYNDEYESRDPNKYIVELICMTL
jgi:hypothetical protein